MNNHKSFTLISNYYMNRWPICPVCKKEGKLGESWFRDEQDMFCSISCLKCGTCEHTNVDNYPCIDCGDDRPHYKQRRDPHAH